jgi:hypothetical protein
MPRAGSARVIIQSFQRRAIVETLLNSLEAERYVRGPLLATVADELSAAGEGLEAAACVARTILERWQAGRLAEAELAFRIRSLRPLIEAHWVPAQSSERASAA